MKKRKNILKEAIVLLIAAAMLLSTVAVTADTEDDVRNRQSSFAEVDYTYIESDPVTYLQSGPVIFDQQPIPDETGGHGPFSDAGQGNPPYRCYENFWDLTEDIYDVHWWGLFGFGSGQPTEGDEFEISFCADNGGIPDYNNHIVDFTGSLGTEISYVGTGDFYWGYELFYMEMDLPNPVSMASGWVSVYKTTVNAQKFAWLDGLNCDNKAYQLNGNPPALTYDLAFQLTGKPCEPSVDVEKYVQCPCTEEWFDADTREEALDLPICTDFTFKIVIHNNGECCGDLFDINVYDKMHESLKFISADPEPQEFGYDPPYYYIFWNFPGPLPQCHTIEIYITAHVEGPDCSIDENYVEVIAHTECDPPEVNDDDYAYVHAYENKPPTAPTITGRRKGNPGTAYRWNFHSSDPNGDDVQYIIDWGDGNTETTPCTPSCTPYDVVHTYAAEGDYEIKAKAKDCCWGLEGPESTFKVSMPRNRAKNTPVLQFLQNYLQMFPMLRLLVQRLGL